MKSEVVEPKLLRVSGLFGLTCQPFFDCPLGHFIVENRTTRAMTYLNMPSGMSTLSATPDLLFSAQKWAASQKPSDASLSMKTKMEQGRKSSRNRLDYLDQTR
jgi:hypothetical protein